MPVSILAFGFLFLTSRKLTHALPLARKVLESISSRSLTTPTFILGIRIMGDAIASYLPFSFSFDFHVCVHLSLFAQENV